MTAGADTAEPAAAAAAAANDEVAVYRPRLRAHLRYADGKVVDELLGRELEVEGAAAALAARLDGALAWDALRAAMIADGHDGVDVDGALRGFFLLHFVEGAGDEAMARLARVAAGDEEVPTSILDGARFACQGSGACCSGYAFGPLTDADVERLEGLDLAGAFPDLAAPYVEERDDGARYLQKRGDDCAFLGDDHKCRIHRRFGADAKPGFCRLYPLDAFGTVDGLRIVDRGTCATFGVSSRRGLPLLEDLPRVHALLDPPVLYHPVALVDGRGWDYAIYLRFTRSAIDLVGRRLGSAIDTLGAVARCLDALAQSIECCPLEPGQPDAMVDAILSVDGAAWYRPPRPEAARRGADKLAELVLELAATVAAALDEGRTRASTPRFREFRTFAERLARVIATADGSEPEPAHSRDVDEALRISLRQQLFGRQALVDGHAGIGLVRMGLVLLCALAGARWDAGRRKLTPADLSRGHMLAARVFHTHALEDLLADHDVDWRELIDGLALAARAVDLPPVR